MHKSVNSLSKKHICSALSSLITGEGCTMDVKGKKYFVWKGGLSIY
jgi:hypothetical protein